LTATLQNVSYWPFTLFTALQKAGRYRINSGQTAPSGLTGSAAFDPQETFRVEIGRQPKLVGCRVPSFSPFDFENTPFARDTLEGLAAAVAEA
jgi:hypothetical protein